MEITAGICRGGAACTDVGRPIYFDPGAFTRFGRDAERMSAAAFVHELGHQYDYGLSEPERQYVMRLLHVSGPWHTDDHDSSPDELFAEAYRRCAGFGYPETWLPAFDYTPTGLVRRVCRFVKAR